MGMVYLARDTTLDRPVALKFLSRALEHDEDARRRFLREAKAAAALDHPYICKIYQTGERGSRPFIAMEYVRGETLRQRLDAGPLPLTDALWITVEVVEALETAHAAQIVHRDLKPANIMLTADRHVKVLDWPRRTSKRRLRQHGTVLTDAGTVQGRWPTCRPSRCAARTSTCVRSLFRGRGAVRMPDGETLSWPVRRWKPRPNHHHTPPRPPPAGCSASARSNRAASLAKPVESENSGGLRVTCASATRSNAASAARRGAAAGPPLRRWWTPDRDWHAGAGALRAEHGGGRLGPTAPNARRPAVHQGRQRARYLATGFDRGDPRLSNAGVRVPWETRCGFAERAARWTWRRSWA